MKTRRQLTSAKDRVLLIKAALFTLIPMLLSPAAVAEEPSSGIPISTGDDQIEIVADKLVTNQAEKFAEFSGNVSARQGAFVINADHLKIHHQAAPGSAAQRATGQDSIKRIVATGNVMISIGKFTAEANRAEYDLKTEVLVLSGENSVLKSDRNILTGSKIIVDRKTGQMRVESDPQERVKAVFYPDESSEDNE